MFEKILQSKKKLGKSRIDHLFFGMSSSRSDRSSSSSSSSSKRKRDEEHDKHRSSRSDKDRHRSSRRDEKDRDGDRDSRRDRKHRSRSRSRDRDSSNKRQEEKRHRKDGDNKGSDAPPQANAENGGSKIENAAPPAPQPAISQIAAPVASVLPPVAAPSPAAPAASKSILPGLNLDALRAMKEKLKMEVQKKSQEQQKGPTPAAAAAATTVQPGLRAAAPQDAATAEKMRIMADMQSKINAKLAALQGRLPPGVLVPLPTAAPSSGTSAPGFSSSGPGPRPLRLDAEGREIDDQGRVISSGRAPVVATLAINKRVQREELFKLESPAIETDPTKNPYFDPRMRAPKVTRPRRAFNFVEAGTYVRKAQRMRTKLAKELLENAMGSIDEEMDGDAPRDKSLMPMGGLRKEAEQIIHKEDEPVPDVEWWDAPLLLHKERYGNESTSADEERAAEEGGIMVVVADEESKGKEKAKDGELTVSNNLNERRITHLVEHPVALAPPTEKPPPGPMPLKLTKAEQKKMRRRARAEKQREQQERVLLGLDSAPKNRMKISNMMKVLTTEAVQDPTQIEKMVRAEMEERAKAHDARNQERKLTPEQRSLKKLKKLKEDTNLITHVALFRVTNLSDERHKCVSRPPPSALCCSRTCHVCVLCYRGSNDLVCRMRNRYKVDINAQQNFLTGCAVLYRGCCLVLVEGGPKAIERYKKLMMRRVDWNDYTKPEEAESEGGMEVEKEEKPKQPDRPQNFCDLVWEGTVLRPSFRNFQVDLFPSEKDARKFLKQRGVPHYWDVCRCASSVCLSCLRDLAIAC
jgi:U4/U6 small nuclear ribonucleoprotein PRP3